MIVLIRAAEQTGSSSGKTTKAFAGLDALKIEKDDDGLQILFSVMDEPGGNGARGGPLKVMSRVAIVGLKRDELDLIFKFSAENGLATTAETEMHRILRTKIEQLQEEIDNLKEASSKQQAKIATALAALGEP